MARLSLLKDKGLNAGLERIARVIGAWEGIRGLSEAMGSGKFVVNCLAPVHRARSHTANRRCDLRRAGSG